MSAGKRRIRIKFQNNLGEEIEKIFGTSELNIEVEESKNLYKALSTNDNIEDWDWEETEGLEEKDDLSSFTPEVSCALPKIKIDNSIEKLVDNSDIVSFQNLAQLIKSTWIVSRELPNLDIISIAKIKNLYQSEKDAASFDVMGIKAFLEAQYKGDLSVAKKEVSRLLTENWDFLKEQPSFISVVTGLYKK